MCEWSSKCLCLSKHKKKVEGRKDTCNVDCIKSLAIRLSLNEYLVVKVVVVACHKNVNLPHDFQNIKALL